MNSLALRTVAAAVALTVAAASQTRMLAFSGANAFDRLGAAAGAAGDVDRDGYADVLIGAPTAWANGPFSGWAGLYSGRTGALLRSWNGTSAYQGFGSAMCTLGDIDGDRVPDYVIAGAADQTNGPSSGRVFVFSGATGRVIFDILGDGAGDLFGHAVAAAGDVDGDGVTDLIVGAPENGDPVPNYGPGYAKVFSGRTGALLHRWNGRELMVEMGQAVDGVGDLDRDGHADVVVTSVLDGVAGQVGTARVFSGRTGAEIFVLRSLPPYDHFGVSAIGVGDTNGDGIPDIAVGAAEMGTRLPGNVTIFSGQNGARLLQIHGQDFMHMFSVSLAAVGDVDRDGAADLAIAAPGALGMKGAVEIRSGRDGSLLRTIEGLVPGTMFGFPIVNAGDVNKDGNRELLIGSRGEGGASGAAFIYSCDDVAPIGAGCGQFAPTLASSPWRVGTMATLRLSGGESVVRAQVFASFVPSTPTHVIASCTAYLHGPTALQLGRVQLNARGEGTTHIRVPALLDLVGLSLAVQASVHSQVDPLVVSNGVITRIVQ